MNLNSHHNFFGGLEVVRGSRAAPKRACGGVFSKQTLADEKPTSTNQTNDVQEGFRRPVLQSGRAVPVWSSSCPQAVEVRLNFFSGPALT